MAEAERWHLVVADVDHEVVVEPAALTRTVVWSRDGVEVGRKRTSDEKVVLAPDGADGAVRVVCGLVGPVRRVTLHRSEAEAHTGLGGTDLEPEAGSRAARRAEWIGAHPHLHTARQTALAAAGVAVPVLLLWLLARVPWPSVDLPSVPWPDLPSIPWPDLPAIPWPDVRLPSIPWPDLPDLPGWVEPVRKLALPVLIAFVVARGEVRRRRRAEEARRADEERRRSADEQAADASADR